MLPGSPAIDAGGAGCSGTDQRGVTRPVGTACDIGAVESQGFTFSAQTGSPQAIAKNTAFPTPLGLTVTSSHSEPVVGGVVTFTGPGSGADITTDPLTASITGMAGASTGTVSQSVMANGTAGRFTVIASTAGVPTSGTGGSLTYALANATTVTSISHTVPAASLTNATSVTYTVTFADPLSSLTSGDFTVTVPMGSGVTGASVTNVSGSGTTWMVTVNTGTGDGDLRLDFTGAATDAVPPVSNAPFTTGQSYTIDKTASTVTSIPSPLPAATAGQAYSASFTASDAHTPVITGATGLPASFTFTPGTGAMANTAMLTGTPTSGTAIMITVQAQDALGNTTNQPYTITVAKAATTTSVTAMPTSTAQGVSVTLTATIAGSGTGVPLPTGSVVFTSGSTPLGTGTLDGTGKATVMTTVLPVGMDTITASYSGDGTFAASTGMGSATVTGAAVTGLTVTAPTGSGSNNSGTASMPRLAPGASLTLTVTGSYTNGMMGSVSGVTFMSSDPTKVSVDANGKLMAIAPGLVVITASGPGGTATLTVTVATVPTGGLMNPNPAPGVHTSGTTMAPTPAPQPGTHPTGGSSGVQPQAAGGATAPPAPQPVRH